MGIYAKDRLPDGKLHSCENCGTLHYAGGWGGAGTSGRFCRERCARQFSSVQRYKNMDRAEIGRRISAAQVGTYRPLSPKGRAKQRAAVTAYWVKWRAEKVRKDVERVSPRQEEKRRLQRNSLSGKRAGHINTEATRLKMSESAKKRWAKEQHGQTREQATHD